MSETSGIVILQRKVNRLKAETGNDKLRSKLDTGLTTIELLKLSIVRPTKLLFGSSICFLVSLYIAVIYSYFYILVTTFTAVYQGTYGWGSGLAGLAYLGLGIGSLIGQFSYTHFGNKIVNKHLERGDFEPEHRLYMMCIGGFFVPAGLFIYGWCTEYHTHFIIPILATGLIGFGLLMTFMPATTYLVDVFTLHAASAMAATTVLRSLFGAFLPLSGKQMYGTLGYGWGNSLLGFVAAAMIPIPYLFIKYGERIRARSNIKL
jgi:MFS family permease